MFLFPSIRKARAGLLVALIAVLVGVLGTAGSAGADGAGVAFVSSADDVVFGTRPGGVDGSQDRRAADVIVANGSDAAQTICLTTDALRDGESQIRVGRTAKAGAPPTSAGSACARVAAGATARFSLTRPADEAAAFELVASSNDGSIARLSVPAVTSTTEAWWHEWWDGFVVVSIRSLAEVLLLGVLISVLANWAADGMSSAWRQLPRPEFLRTAGYLVAALGLANILLNRGSQPDAIADRAWLHGEPGWFGWGVGFVVLLIAAGALLGSWQPMVRAIRRGRREWPAATTGSRFAEERRRRLAWLAIAGGLVSAAVLALLWEWPASGWRSALTGLVTIIIGAVLVTWQSAYCPRLTLPDGSGDDAAKVVAAVRDALASLTPDATRRISLAVGPDTATVASTALAPIAGGPWMNAIVAVRDALVPHAGLRLRVWSASKPTTGGERDDERVRVHAVIDRGRRQVAAELIDSHDFHPESQATDRTQHDSVQEAASALAAWLLVTAGGEVKARDWGLYQTTSWRSLALQMAGSRRDAAGDTAGARALFNRACGDDARNLPARFNSISAKTVSLFADHAEDPASVTGAAVDQAQVCEQLASLRELVEDRYPGSPLALRAAYLEVSTRLYAADPTVRGAAAERAKALLAALAQQGIDPFAYIDAEALKKKLMQEIGPIDRIRKRDLPHGADRHRAREYGEYVAPSAMVLWIMSGATAHGAEALESLRGRRDVPVRARYNVGCALVRVPALAPVGRPNREEAWTEIRTAMIDERLARWALRDPDLRTLWRPVEPHQRSYLSQYLERQVELRRAIDTSATSDLLAFGLSAQVATKLDIMCGVRDIAGLRKVPDPMGRLAPCLEPTEWDAVKKQLPSLGLAARPAIGASNAERLHAVGLGHETLLFNADPRDVRGAVCALLRARGEDPGWVTPAVVRGWQFAVGQHPKPSQSVSELAGQIAGAAIIIDVRET